MKKTLILLVILLNLAAIGCKSLTSTAIKASQSAFLTQFSLHKTVANINAPGLDCSKFGEGGGIGGSAGGVGSDSVSHNQSYTIFCEIEGSGQFQEAGLIQSLKSEIDRKIQSAGAQIQGSTTSSNRGFQIEYVEGKIHGKVEMLGEKKESYYIVTVNVEERNR